MEELTLRRLRAILVVLLDNLEVPRRASVGILLMLGEDKEKLKDWILWVDDNHPTEQMIMDKLLGRDREEEHDGTITPCT